MAPPAAGRVGSAAAARCDGGRHRRQGGRCGAHAGRRPRGWLGPRHRRVFQGPTQDGPLHPLRPGRGAAGAGAGGLGAHRGARPAAHGHRHRIGHRRFRCHCRGRAHHGCARAAAPVAVHRAVLSGQPGRRPGVHPPRAQGPAGCARHRVCGQRAGHWRRRAPDPLRRGRRGRLRRHRGQHRPREPGRLRGGQGALHRVCGSPRAGIPPLRRGARRLRDGRGRRHAGARIA
ncbi:hypothetical protein D9M69_533140 [compost metagenome]